MKTTYTEAMRGVFAHEGGYFNHPSDPGGPTNWGITIADARNYWKADANAADVKAMPKSVAEKIYRERYAAPLRYDELPAGLDYCVLDYGINSGISRSGKVLRRVCGLPDSDWHVTADVLAAVAKRDPKALITAICDERLRFLMNLKTWPVFGKGWGRRVREVRALALALASKVTTMPVEKPVPAPAPVAGKGAVPASTGLQTGTAAGGTAIGGAAAVTWQGWIAAHVIETGLMVVAAIMVVGVIIYFINRNEASKQDAPTPGVVPVPEMKVDK